MTLQTFIGSCHCGEVGFEVDSDLKELTTCDCSICRRRNALMLRVHEGHFRLLRGEAFLGLYQFHTLTAKHYFCRRCGIYTFHRKRVTPDFFGVNVFCLAGLDLKTLPVRATSGADMP
ncbi:MAG TPA: GFA family protein [Rhizomicrobium sp.]|nr:GFA family protein [Rhizomicrobium sp.]